LAASPGGHGLPAQAGQADENSAHDERRQADRNLPQARRADTEGEWVGAAQMMDSQMEQRDVFSSKIRWLAIAVGLSAAALSCLLSPLAAVIPALLPLGAALQPSLPDPGKWIVKWFIWAWALGWSPFLVGTSFLMLLNNLPHSRYFVVLRVLSTVSALLIVWWDIELIVDGARRTQIWRSTPVQEPRPVGLGLWILAVAVTLWFGWGLVRMISIYHGPSDLYALVMSILEVAIVVAFDIYLTWKVVKLRRAGRVHH